MITIKELKKMLEGKSDDTLVLITKDQEWNEVRECVDIEDEMLWNESNQDYQSIHDLEEEDMPKFKKCIILS